MVFFVCLFDAFVSSRHCDSVSTVTASEKPNQYRALWGISLLNNWFHIRWYTENKSVFCVHACIIWCVAFLLQFYANKNERNKNLFMTTLLIFGCISFFSIHWFTAAFKQVCTYFLQLHITCETVIAGVLSVTNPTFHLRLFVTYCVLFWDRSTVTQARTAQGVTKQIQSSEGWWHIVPKRHVVTGEPSLPEDHCSHHPQLTLTGIQKSSSHSLPYRLDLL